ncbi:hypothetical protein B0H16DRAFT_1734291 [Mycena metata]|uniref:F-box domain-containing protein n=1 Tax=Mycena metata TaxID=1033252 RepID=A0AAD7HVM9_9AGAR|nr:hypothetical protein B0H16DRAFT_1734291 [Mycena metata]
MPLAPVLWRALPYDVQRKIIDLVLAPSSLREKLRVKLCASSSDWMRFVFSHPHYWTHIIVTSRSTPDRVRHLVSLAFPLALHLHLLFQSSPLPAALGYLLPHVASASHFTVETDSVGAVERLHAVFSAVPAPRMRSFQLLFNRSSFSPPAPFDHDNPMPWFGSFFPDLESLHLRCACMPLASASLTSLRDLDLSGWLFPCRITSADLSAVVTGCPFLESLTLFRVDFPDIGDDAALPLIRSTSVTSLRLGFGGQYTLQTFVHFLDLPSLSSLVLDILSQSDVAASLSLPPRLTSAISTLIVRGNRSFPLYSDFEFPAEFLFSRFTLLTTLDISQAASPTFDSLLSAWLSRNQRDGVNPIPGLKSLYVSNATLEQLEQLSLNPWYIAATLFAPIKRLVVQWLRNVAGKVTKEMQRLRGIDSRESPVGRSFFSPSDFLFGTASESDRFCRRMLFPFGLDVARILAVVSFTLTASFVAPGRLLSVLGPCLLRLKVRALYFDPIKEDWTSSPPSFVAAVGFIFPSLPPEVMSNIFRHVCLVHDRTLRLFRQACYQLSHVCRGWRDIVRGDPSFWQTLVIDETTSSQYLDDFMRYSRQCAIVVAFALFRGPPPRRFSDALLASAVHTLPSLHRWVALEFYIDDRGTLDALTTFFANRRAPRLRFFAATSRTFDFAPVVRPSPDPPLLFAEDIHQLEHVVLDGVPFLRPLLSPMQRLVSLSLDSIPPSSWPTFHAFVQLVTLSPGLRSVSLNSVGFTGRPPSLPVVVHHVVRLDLSFGFGPLDSDRSTLLMLAALSFQHLNFLRLSFRNTAAVVDLLNASLAFSTRRVCVEGVCSDISVARSLYFRVAGVVSLDLCHGHPDMVAALAPCESPAGDIPLPTLDSLDLYAPDWSALLPVLAHRASYGARSIDLLQCTVPLRAPRVSPSSVDPNGVTRVRVNPRVYG